MSGDIVQLTKNYNSQALGAQRVTALHTRLLWRSLSSLSMTVLRQRTRFPANCEKGMSPKIDTATEKRSLLSVLSRLLYPQIVSVYIEKNNEQIPYKSVHCIKFMQMCQKTSPTSVGLVFCPYGTRIMSEAAGGGFMNRCAHR